jgi:anti-sigma regulatory factor (Ser/Thr protein kinase)
LKDQQLLGPVALAGVRVENHAEARAVRRQIVALLRAHAAPGSDLAATELIVSELVGNGLKYGTGWVALTLEWEDERAVLHVCDGGNAFEVPAGLPAEPSSESGRGLFLVQAISHGLDIQRIDDGNRVRVVLPVRRGKPLPPDSR